MERAAAVEGQEVGDVDQGADRLLPDRPQPPLQPVGRRTVGHPAHDAAEEGGAGVGIVRANLDRARKGPGDRGDRRRDQHSDPGGGKVARDPRDAHAVLPVRCHRDLDHRIVEPGPRGVARPHRRVGGQVDNPVVLVRQLELAHRAHHAAALDPADRRDLERQVTSGDIHARRAEHAFHAGARVRRAADDLDRIAVAGGDGQDAQLVGPRMRRCGQHLGDDEGGEPCGWICHAFDLEADLSQRVDDAVERGVGHKMVAEPRQGEFHAPTPALSVGTSVALKP